MRAACWEKPHLFFPPDEVERNLHKENLLYLPAMVREAKKLCAVCPFSSAVGNGECAEWGKGQLHGIWDGETPAERGVC